MAAMTGFSSRSMDEMSRVNSVAVGAKLGLLPIALEAGEVATRGERLASSGQDYPRTSRRALRP